MNFLLLSLLFFGFHYGFQGLFLSRLKNQYSDTFARISRPGMFTNYYIQKTDAYSIFMHEKEWLQLADNYLNRFNMAKQLCLAPL